MTDRIQTTRPPAIFTRPSPRRTRNTVRIWKPARPGETHVGCSLFCDNSPTLTITIVRSNQP